LPRAAVADPVLSKRGRRSSRHPWICQCIGMQPFLPRDAYAYRGLCRGKMSVRPSVCHTPVLCLKGYIYPQSFFPPAGSPTILVFLYQLRDGNISTGTHLSGASNAKGYKKITIFDKYLALSRK